MSNKQRKRAMGQCNNKEKRSKLMRMEMCLHCTVCILNKAYMPKVEILGLVSTLRKKKDDTQDLFAGQRNQNA